MYSHASPAVRVLAPFVAGLNISTPDLAIPFGIPGEPYNWGPPDFFPEPSFPGEFGMAWDTLVNYWYLTGDGSHNTAVQAALQAALDHQSEDKDHLVWGLAAMTAAERARWDTSTCGGGLSDRYDYMDSESPGFFFQLAARLARFTGNQTYIDWASRSYDWMRSTGLINSDTFAVYDGTYPGTNCTNIVHEQSSFRDASLAYGSAILVNTTSNTTWSDRASSHLSRILRRFFRHDIIREQACKPEADCTFSQHFFPALTLRWLALQPIFQPAAVDAIAPALAASAVAATDRCSTVYGDAGAFAQCTDCWVDDIWSDDDTDDDDTGGASDDADDVERMTCLGQQLAALDALLASYVVGRDGGINASMVLRTSSSGSGRGNGSSATAAEAVALRLQEA
ncbi:Mannan endo-1,6-alpha-mannosidase DCW1 [Lasiodiplodia theobromae]|uniref:mannan endo-1,6-alpha-mannosidase n=1 Tax=Lasiodiplodia theobromae TaxID=45133 RepID=A0A5N5D936_9PEZI|nr:Mannan endo-1,6-alpha-mannosidase DCW1 [Lasiodiplodia theobromae]